MPQRTAGEQCIQTCRVFDHFGLLLYSYSVVQSIRRSTAAQLLPDTVVCRPRASGHTGRGLGGSCSPECCTTTIFSATPRLPVLHCSLQPWGDWETSVLRGVLEANNPASHSAAQQRLPTPSAVTLAASILRHSPQPCYGAWSSVCTLPNLP